MTNEYIKISERENILDSDVSKILDYIERHCKTIEKQDDYTYNIDGNFGLYFSLDFVLVLRNDKVDMVIRKSIFADNVVGLYGGIKNIGK